jgi:hypothetical protein
VELATMGPQQLVLPAATKAALDQAVSAGVTEAAHWAIKHPDRPAEHFDRNVLMSVGAPPSGDAQAADLAASHAAMTTRTSAGNEWATYLARTSGWDQWKAIIDDIGRTHGAAQARRAADLLHQAHERNAAVIDAAKQQYGRLRPYQVDSTITTVVPQPNNNASWPSGHSAGAYVAALVLGALAPEHAAELRAMADQVAYSRVYGGVHFTSDVVEGARIGARIAADVLRRAGVAVPGEAARAVAA